MPIFPFRLFRHPWRYGLPLLFLLVCISCSAVSDDVGPRREQALRAISRGVLTPFDLSFADYVNLDLWDQLDDLIQANSAKPALVRLESPIAGPPVLRHESLRFFSDLSPGSPGILNGISPFNLKALPPLSLPDSLTARWSLATSLDDGRILFGASDQNSDLLALWRPENQSVRTFVLPRGHYIHSLLVDNQQIYAGACGGIVAEFQADNAAFSEYYSAPGAPAGEQWEAFNRLPCFHRLHLFNTRLYAASESAIYYWPDGSSGPARTIRRHLPGGLIFFFEDQMIEIRNRQLISARLADGRSTRLRKRTLPFPVADIAVSRTLLPRPSDTPAMAIAYAGGKGIDILQLTDLETRFRISAPADHLIAYQDRLIGLRERTAFSMNLQYLDPAAFRTFISDLRPDDILWTQEQMASISERAWQWPDVVSADEMATAALRSAGLSIDISIRYGRYGDDPQSPPAYYLECRMRNTSPNDKAVLIEKRIRARSAGITDRKSAEQNTRENYWIPVAAGGSQLHRFYLGAESPHQYQAMPLKTSILPSGALSEIKSLLSTSKPDKAAIQSFLSDPRFQIYFSRLRALKKAHEKEDSGSWWSF